MDYDGFTYCLYCKIDTSSKKIVFIQYGSPADLEKWSALLDNLVNTADATKADTIVIANYSQELKKLIQLHKDLHYNS